MDLLVSAANVADAREALAGGADIVDANDPGRGALGAVTHETLRAIHAAVGGACAVSAALGDAADEADVERAAHDAAVAGAHYVKFGLAGVSDGPRASALLAAAVRGTARDGPTARVIAVAYADAERVGALAPRAVIEAAARAGVHGVLADTARKDGPSLTALLTLPELAAWVAEAHEAGLLAALAGKLTRADMPTVRDAGADVAGVRGAACSGGRGGHVSAALVRSLRSACVVRLVTA